MMEIIPGDLDDPRVLALLHTHVATARAVTPAGSAHAFDPEGLRRPEIGFWAVWDDDVLMAVGALHALTPDLGEVKSMHTAEALRGRGAGGAMLRHIIAEARAGGHRRLGAETGAMDYFAPARALYQRHGFAQCEPFGSYLPDRNSIFLTLEL